MADFRLYYDDGHEIRKGDRVLFNRTRLAVVAEILYPGSRAACDRGRPNGGFRLDFDDGDRYIFPDADEDFELIGRESSAGDSE